MRSTHKQKNPTISNVKSLDFMIQQNWTNPNLSGQGPSILLAQDRSVAQKPHWGFRCPGVQAVLDCLHQIVQLFVDLSQLLFQQRNRGVFLILDIHDQLNDLVDHRIVLNQLHRLPDDQIFQPVLLHGFFVAALTPLDVGAYLNFFSKCFTILRILARAVSFSAGLLRSHY